MRRREFISLLGGAVTAWPLGANAQQVERMRRIGFLHGLVENDPEAQARIKAFRHGLEALGWTEGRNIQVDYRFARGDACVMSAFAVAIGVKRTWLIAAHMTAFDPKRTSAGGTWHE